MVFFIIYRAIDFNTLIGNIGGYVGLLLGVSILQAPTLMVQLFGNLMKFCMKKSTHSATHVPGITLMENGESQSKYRLSLRTYKTTSKITNERTVPALTYENDAANFLNDIVNKQI